MTLSVALYAMWYGVPAVGFGWYPVAHNSAFSVSGTVPTRSQFGNALRVLAVFAPGALAFVPLFGGSMRHVVRACHGVRAYRRKVGLTLAAWWMLPVVAWELTVVTQVQGLAPIPGHTVGAAVVPFEASILAILSIAGIVWEQPDQLSPIKPAWRPIALTVIYPLFALLVLVEMQPSGWPP